MKVPPFITAWSDEQGYVVRQDPLVMQPALFSQRGERGCGAPIWGRISEERQRFCAVLRRCQVCSALLPNGVGFSLVPCQALDGHLATTEPLCCQRCLGAVVGGCPALQRMRLEQALMPFLVTRYRIALTMATPNTNNDADPEILQAMTTSGCHTPVVFCWLVLIEGASLSLTELDRFAAGARIRMNGQHQ